MTKFEIWLENHLPKIQGKYIAAGASFAIVFGMVTNCVPRTQIHEHHYDHNYTLEIPALTQPAN